MQTTITQLWNGSLSPVKRLGKNHAELQELEKLLQRNKARLTDALDRKQAETFQKYDDCIWEYITLLCEQAFCDGYGLGTVLTAEAFSQAASSV